VKRYFGIIVIIGGILIAAVMTYRTSSAKALEAQREADFTRLQKDYLERVGWIRTNPDPASYGQEINSFFKTYFEQVSSHQNRYRLSKEFDAYLDELESRGGKDERAQDKKAFYDYTRKVFDQMREGRYKPVWSATDKGMRLDVLSSDVVMVMNKPQVRLQLVLWGAQREERLDGKMKKMVTSASFKTQWKLTDEKGKLVGEMNGDDPSMKVDFPERFIAEFPPQMVLGHYELDLVPASVARMDVTFQVATRGLTGSSVMANYVWKLDVPAEWKLAPGEKWDGAMESERPEEEINPAKASRAL
jgi:hypothetical protein